MPCKNHTVLVVIDVQGKLAKIVQDSENFIRNLKILINGAHLLGISILWTEQTPDKLGPTIPDISKLLKGEPIIKNMFSCARDEVFMKKLEALKPHHILLAGIETHVCVLQTAKDLLENYDVAVVADAVSSRTEFNKQIGLDGILLAGGSQTSVESILFELQEIAEGETFRQLIKLVK